MATQAGSAGRIRRRRALLLIGFGVPAAAVALAEYASPRSRKPDALTVAVVEELGTFSTWLTANRALGYIGEVGWPDNTEGDAASWNGVAEAWYEAADRAGLWVTAWATGEWWGQKYHLAAYYASSDGVSVDTRNTQATVLEGHASTSAYYRGITVAGGSFGSASIETLSPFSNENPGTYDIDYHYDSQGTFDFLRTRGVRLVRIDFRWERLQPRLGQPLDPLELGRIQDVIDRAGKAGMRVVLDLHNYGAYFLFDGRQGVRRPIGSDEVSVEHLSDVWRRLSAVFSQDERVLAYGLMNEPADLPTRYVSRITLDDSHGWQPDAGGSEVLTFVREPTHSGGGALKISKSFPPIPAYGHLRFHDGGGLIASHGDVSRLGDTIAAWVFLPEETPGAHWEARLFVYGDKSASESNTSVGLERAAWTRVTSRFAPEVLRTAKAIGLQVYANDVRGTAWVAVDAFSIGAELRPAELWELASQTAVSAIRDAGDRKLIMVSGYGWSRAQDWTRNHPKAWIEDPAGALRYEAHHYWDRDESSFYRRRYADERTAAVELQH